MVLFDILVPCIIGLVIGLIVAYVFTKYSSVSAPYSATIFGIASNSLVTGTMLFILVTGLTALVGLSVVVKDTEFITKYPIKFMMELILMGILPALALMFVIYSRTGKITSTDNFELILLALKFAGLHVLLQTCGILRYSLT